MTGYLSKSLQEELAGALKKTRRRRATRSVHVGDEALAILDFSEDGFTVDAEDAPRLRGLIDIFDGPRHLYQALIVASEQQDDVMRYEFKRNTMATSHAPKDFDPGDSAAAGLLSSR